MLKLYVKPNTLCCFKVFTKLSDTFMFGFCVAGFLKVTLVASIFDTFLLLLQVKLKSLLPGCLIFAPFAQKFDNFMLRFYVKLKTVESGYIKLNDRIFENFNVNFKKFHCSCMVARILRKIIITFNLKVFVHHNSSLSKEYLTVSFVHSRVQV